MVSPIARFGAVCAAIAPLRAAAANGCAGTAKPASVAARRLLWAAAGFGGACAAGTLAATQMGPFGAACEEAAKVSLPGTLFMWGKRFTGNDIVGYCDKAPVELSLAGKRQVTHMAFGTSVGAACDKGGDVWWWSEGEEPTHITTAQMILGGKRIVKVACSATSSYAMSKSGRVWTWPNDDPRAAREVAVPGGIFSGGTVVDMSACATGEHMLCVTSDGRALAMGSGSRGQLGGGNCEDKATLTPVKLPKGSSATKCAAGSQHSLVLTKDGSVLAFGGDDTMQLGQGRATINQWRADKEPLTSAVFRAEPHKISLMKANVLAHDGAKCIAVAAGHDFSAAIFQTPGKPNCLVSWGNGWRKQLGHKNDMHMSAPRIVTTLQGRKEWNQQLQTVEEIGVRDVACGQEHMLVVMDNGSLLAWGYNREGEVGVDSRAAFKIPQLIMPLQRYRIAAIFAGARNSAAIVEGAAEYM